MSGTSTLTIEIGDKNNNQHTDGYKEIFVYNYKGIENRCMYQQRTVQVENNMLNVLMLCS